jgi:hypothetical protein
MGARAVDWARLESVCTVRYRGFESLPIRHVNQSFYVSDLCKYWSQHRPKVLALALALLAKRAAGVPHHPVRRKTSLRDFLLPIAERVGGELLLPTGEASDTILAEMAQRAAADDRLAAVLYFSDFDPSGWQMAISVSRKLQALRDLLHHDLDIQVHPVALACRSTSTA